MSFLAQYNTSDPTSFAYISARERWPIIITQGIDDVHRTTWATKDEIAATEGKHIVSELARLKYELQHNRELTPIPDDGEPDVAEYNDELHALGPSKWHSVAWLYAECYLYRYVELSREGS
jgi:damage-control phosphatase, subfamily III